MTYPVRACVGLVFSNTTSIASLRGATTFAGRFSCCRAHRCQMPCTGAGNSQTHGMHIHAGCDEQHDVDIAVRHLGRRSPRCQIVYGRPTPSDPAAIA